MRRAANNAVSYIEPGNSNYWNPGKNADTEAVVQPGTGQIQALAEDRPYSYFYTYKYGQAKLVFLSETYGERVIQGVLDQSPRLAGGGRRNEPKEGFMQLLGHVAGETPAQMDARWSTWARKRVMRTYLDAKQDLPDVTELKAGDIVYSGTPENVGAVVKGDVLLCKLEGLADMSIRIV